ncbi:glucosamine-6-phosphate deaminase [Candidatus Poriferisocius sp.]|uniref:glucosamine-6-phosphate deaminase n=1 Tax=Candidatus Poriferisocius sp. TaxID=3101276 RepID=UPI003B02B344
MRVHILADAAATAERAADIVEGAIRSTPHPGIGLATGSTMVGVYRSLARRCREGTLSFSEATVYLLDEYIGLDADHPQTYRNVITRSFTELVDLRNDAVFAPDCQAPDLDGEARRYDRLVRAAGIDIQLLGIGGNGHIAFNEPGTPFDAKTNVVSLSEATRRDNARFFDSLDDVPGNAITQGIGTILQAKQILLVAQGSHKSRPVRDALEGPVSTETPASAVQLHPNVAVVLDREAASLLSNLRPES